MLMYNNISRENCYEDIFRGLLTVFSAAGQQGRTDIMDICRTLFSDPDISAAEERITQSLRSRDGGVK